MFIMNNILCYVWRKTKAVLVKVVSLIIDDFHEFPIMFIHTISFITHIEPYMKLIGYSGLPFLPD